MFEAIDNTEKNGGDPYRGESEGLERKARHLVSAELRGWVHFAASESQLAFWMEETVEAICGSCQVTGVTEKAILARARAEAHRLVATDEKLALHRIQAAIEQIEARRGEGLTPQEAVRGYYDAYARELVHGRLRPDHPGIAQLEIRLLVLDEVIRRR